MGAMRLGVSTLLFGAGRAKFSIFVEVVAGKRWDEERRIRRMGRRQGEGWIKNKKREGVEEEKEGSKQEDARFTFK